MFEWLGLEHLGYGALALLFVSLLIAFGFEFVNGFHDTANAVATVIYTKSLGAVPAVILSGLFNFIGVLIGGTAVAFTIVHLFPVDILVNIGTHTGLAMLMSLLLAAILWNLGTWFYGLPASSSHTLIGSILGVGLANAYLTHVPYGSAMTFEKVTEVLLSLMISPLIGFLLAAFLLLVLQRLVRDPRIFDTTRQKHPPTHVRAGLILTSIGVSFAHGSNDGQKGVGLIMLILIGILPFEFALNLNLNAQQIEQSVAALGHASEILEQKKQILNDLSDLHQHIQGGLKDTGISPLLQIDVAPLQQEISELRGLLDGVASLKEMPVKKRWEVRTQVLLIHESLMDLLSTGRLIMTDDEMRLLRQDLAQISSLTEYAPRWVILFVALSLGIGTMVGWRRIVVTIGEKIGKTRMNYAQGFSTQVVAAGTILMGSHFGLPISTTHVLSSGVAGTMYAGKGGLQGKTMTNILLAWVFTFPAAMLLAGGLFSLMRLFVP